MLPDDRLVLIDLENVVGFRPKPRTLRDRVSALLTAAGPHHHAVAAYATDDLADDPTASLLAALGVAPLRVLPGPDAAETALLAHAKRMRAEGCTHFTVCSSDRAFAALADTDTVHLDVLIWHGQPVSARLEHVAEQVRRLPRPGAPNGDPAPRDHTGPGRCGALSAPSSRRADVRSGHRSLHRTGHRARPPRRRPVPSPSQAPAPTSPSILTRNG